MEDAKRSVAYVPFTTFLAAIDSLEHYIPHQIDTSVWPTYSGAIQSQLLGAFRFLGLIDNSGKPTLDLKMLVQDKTNRKVTMRKILESRYARLVSLGLTKVSPKQFDEAVRGYGMTGETHKKVISFFLQAAKYSELPLSPLLLRKVRFSSPRRHRRGDPGRQELATPSGEVLQRTSKTIKLRSGGAVTVSVEGSVLEIGTEDRDLVFALIDKLREYEKQAEGTK
jgi:hypothetical protein